MLEVNEVDLMEVRKALYVAQSKQQALERERDQLLKELASFKLKQHEILAKTTYEKKTVDEMDKDVGLVNGGRLALLIDDDSRKLKLLSDGPRREIPDWMARRIGSVRTKFPPRKINVSEANISKFKSLELPNPAEVWSIAQAKPKEGDTLIEHAIEREVIEKKRKALERALQRKTIQWQETPEEIKLGIFFISSLALVKKSVMCDLTCFFISHRARNWHRA